MAQVQDIVRDALGHLRVLDAAGNVSAIDMRDAIRALNLMLRRWEADGLALGWNDVAEPTDELPLPQEAEEAVGYNLAMRLRSRYGKSLQTLVDVAALADSGLSAILRDRLVAAPLRLRTRLPRDGRYNVYTDSYE